MGKSSSSPEVLPVAPDQSRVGSDDQNVILTTSQQDILRRLLLEQNEISLDPRMQAYLKPLTFYDSQDDGTATVNLSQKEVKRRAELQAGLEALDIPVGKGGKSVPFTTFDAIDKYRENGGKGDGLIGKRDIDTYLNAWSWGNPIPEATRAGLKWLSDHWDDKDVKALRGGGDHFSKEDLIKNLPNLLEPKRPEQPNERNRDSDDPRRNGGGRKKDEGYLNVQTLRPGSYSTDAEDPNRNAESDHTHRWTNGKIEYFIDVNGPGKDIGYTWKGKDGHYMGWKLNSSYSAEEGGPRWELYDGTTVRKSVKPDQFKMDERRGLIVDGKVFDPYEFQHKP